MGFDFSLKAANRRQRVSRTLARVFAHWRTGLSGPVIVLQAGTAVNYFGTGLILPFEIIYLHEVRGFPTATAGLVLAAVMGTAAVVTLPAGALLDRFRAKPILITGNLVSALGYGGLAFVDRPWQGFVCSAVGGAGFGVTGTANQVLSLTLVTPERRAASIALRRVAGNFGLAPARRWRASSSLPPITFAPSRRSTFSMQSPSLSSRWLCSWGSRILALRMLRRRATAEEVSERLLEIGSYSP